MRPLVMFASHLKYVFMGRTGVGPLGSDQAPYFAVSLLKLSVMSVCTGGLYEVYWFYKNWTLIKQQEERADIMPFWRAFFAVFFCYPCFSRIYKDAASLGLRQSSLAGLLAAGWIIAVLLGEFPDPYWWLSQFSFVFLLPVQALVNRMNATTTPQHDLNLRFTIWNLAAVAVFGTAIVFFMARG